MQSSRKVVTGRELHREPTAAPVCTATLTTHMHVCIITLVAVLLANRSREQDLDVWSC